MRPWHGSGQPATAAAPCRVNGTTMRRRGLARIARIPMILCPYHIAPSRIPGAGKGLYIDRPAQAGSILVAPDAINRTYALEEISADPKLSCLLHTSVRWFGDHYTLSPDWPDECFVNHSFEPTGLWHLGFIFANDELSVGTELTVDYRHLLAPGQVEEFRDARTGEPIVGFSWQESIRSSTSRLSALLAAP